ncbi:MAG: transglutaminase-like domain-containing protein [Clostridia bacterium]|jgi:transglutaminase-like putative cysteine protease
MENENKTNRIFVIFLAFLYAVITTGVLSLVLLIPFDYQTCAVVCFVTIFLLSVMSINKKFFRITFSLIIVAVIAFVVVVNKGGRLYIVQQTIYDYGKWIWQALTSLRRDTEPFLNLSVILISVGVSLVCYILIIRKIRLLLLVLFSLPVYVISFLNMQPVGFGPMMLVGVILMILFAITVFREQGKSFAKTEDRWLEFKYIAFVIPMVLLLVLGSYGLSKTYRQDRSSQMNRIVQKTEDKLEEWNIIREKKFEFGGEFNLQSTGFRPGGELGGNVKESNSLAMIVESSIPLYLKGSITDIYTGRSWKPSLRVATTLRSTNITNYVTDATFSERHVFEAAMRALNYRLDRADYDTFFQEGEVEIAHYGLKTNTLFYPQNLIQVELAKQNDRKIRINSNNELYFPFNVVENTNYTVKYRYFVIGHPAAEYLLRQLGRGLLDEYLSLDRNKKLKEKYDYIYERYTETEAVPESVKDLAQRIVEQAGADNRYDMAKAIESYLRENYIYTLSPGPVPAGRDFTEYFLFTGKGGYCTYYATAMTVMLRSLGIPARYVEGFITKEENKIGKIYSVLSKNSHAWVEVFFEGVGWITFEPTSSIEGVVIPGEGTGTGEGVGEYQQEDDIWDWAGGLPEEYFELPDTDVIEDEWYGDYDWLGKGKIKWETILLYILAGILVLFYPVKILLIKLRLLADRKKSPTRAIILYYNRLLKLLDIAGLGLQTGETLFEMTDRKHIVVRSVRRELKMATEAFCSIRFADMERDKKDFNNVYYVYKKMHDNIKFYLGWRRFFVRRYIKGFKIW